MELSGYEKQYLLKTFGASFCVLSVLRPVEEPPLSPHSSILRLILMEKGYFRIGEQKILSCFAVNKMWTENTVA